jgi:zinc transport system substrate-binding protein
MNKSQFLLVAIAVAAAASLVAASLYVGVWKADDRVQVVASFYPLAYMAEEIGGDRVSVNCLIPYNTEVHAWQPSPSDIVAADKADVLLYNGAGLDHWFEDEILPALGASDRIVAETTDGIELIAGGHEDEDDHEHSDTDPHTWLSPFIAEQQAENVYNALVAADPDGAAYYAGRWDNLSAKLTALDIRYQTELSTKTNGTVIVAHGAYGYLAYRYNFEQRGILGLSADEQPSSTALADIADLMQEENISTLYVDPIYSDAYVQTLKAEFSSSTGIEVSVYELYLILGPTDDMDYIQQMEQNLDNLKKGLVG